MRTLVDIGEREIEALDAVARDAGKSRAALIRTAIGEWLVRHRRGDQSDAFGLWRRGEDGLAYQERVRDEW